MTPPWILTKPLREDSRNRKQFPGLIIVIALLGLSCCMSDPRLSLPSSVLGPPGKTYLCPGAILPLKDAWSMDVVYCQWIFPGWQPCSVPWLVTEVPSWNISPWVYLSFILYQHCRGRNTERLLWFSLGHRGWSQKLSNADPKKIVMSQVSWRGLCSWTLDFMLRLLATGDSKLTAQYDH